MPAYLFQMIMLSAVFVDALERRFPAQIKDLLAHVSLNAIYGFSKLQIWMGKCSRQINRFINENPHLAEIRKKWKLVFRREQSKPYSYKGPEGDILLTVYTNFVEKDQESEFAQSIVRYNLDKWNENEAVEGSNIRFLMVECLGKNLALKSDDYNYYVVGNKFSKDFFAYFLHRYHQQETREIAKVKIIDSNVNTVEVEFTNKGESILLEKDGYKILAE